MMRNTAQPIMIENNQYKITETLGQGSYGYVVKGQNLQTHQIVAIKIQESINEAELMMLLKMKGKKYKNLIKTLHVEKIGKYYYMVMEYCKESLYDRIQRQGTIKHDDIRFIMKEIANGLREIHEMGYAHRNITPENVLVFQVKDDLGNTQDLYKICDFGTIKEIDVLKTQKVGTAYYFAPEQINKTSEQYTQAVDIWAFGALIYELLTGVPMFNGSTEYEVCNKISSITQYDIDTIIQNNLKIERKYQTLLLNMMQIDLQKRYDINQTISDLRGQSQIKQKSSIRLEPKQIIQQPSQQPTNIVSQIWKIPQPQSCQYFQNDQNKLQQGQQIKYDLVNPQILQKKHNQDNPMLTADQFQNYMFPSNKNDQPNPQPIQRESKFMQQTANINQGFLSSQLRNQQPQTNNNTRLANEDQISNETDQVQAVKQNPQPNNTFRVSQNNFPQNSNITNQYQDVDSKNNQQQQISQQQPKQIFNLNNNLQQQQPQYGANGRVTNPRFQREINNSQKQTQTFVQK
ncbi:unnamed protein product [Paramecium sonneborni]|uniref:Protein kinase domain-containing protein n=1 Tax=Paramecium sonneborni TaxID=65129 RepID=A0A8S1NH78_9CILI|nr:unnamed protein product [Paramecium sonneborni]